MLNHLFHFYKQRTISIKYRIHIQNKEIKQRYLVFQDLNQNNKKELKNMLIYIIYLTILKQEIIL